MMYRIVITDHWWTSLTPEREVASVLDNVEITDAGCETTDEVKAAIVDADAIIHTTHTFTAPTLDAATRCRIITRYGTGMDTVDIPAATERGIAVCNVVDYCTSEVTEQALALLFAAARKVVEGEHRIRAGDWREARGAHLLGEEQTVRAMAPIRRMEGRTLGLRGFGHIGQAMARKSHGLGFRVIAHSPSVPSHIFDELGVERVSFEDLLAQSDFLSVHTPLTDRTQNLFDEAAFRRMKPSAIFINTGRGGVVDGAALARALHEGWIAAAGLDVMAVEPIPPDDPLLSAPNIVLSPHIGYYSEEALAELQRRTMQNVVDVLGGRRPETLLNPEIADRLGLR